jgi:hypothetical protein
MNDKAAKSDLWVITAFFNLAGWSSRIENYRTFRRAMSVPLATIEWNPFGRFDLAAGDADLLIQVQGGDLMWQKERLLGIALSALPAHVRYVAWVDCDVIFADPAWHVRTRQLLQDYAVVQPFRRVVYLPPELTQRVVRSRELAEVLPTLPIGSGNDAANAIAAAIAEGFDWSPTPDFARASFLDVLERVGDDIGRLHLSRRFGQGYDVTRPTSGYAWSARIDVMRDMGFYERCVVGGGDVLFAYGLVGRSSDVIANHHSVGWDSYGGGPSYRAWAQRAADLCGDRFKCGNDTIVHLYHGTREDRRYHSRVDGLVQFGVDIDRDIAAAPGEPWSWTRDATELNAYFLEYLRNRREDG